MIHSNYGHEIETNLLDKFVPPSPNGIAHNVKQPYMRGMRFCLTMCIIPPYSSYGLYHQSSYHTLCRALD